jgi:hypothetical protein
MDDYRSWSSESNFWDAVKKTLALVGLPVDSKIIIKRNRVNPIEQRTGRAQHMGESSKTKSPKRKDVHVIGHIKLKKCSKAHSFTFLRALKDLFKQRFYPALTISLDSPGPPPTT